MYSSLAPAAFSLLYNHHHCVPQVLSCSQTVTQYSLTIALQLLGVPLLGCTPFHCCSERRFYYLRTEDKLGAAKSNKRQVGLLPVASKQWNILELKEESPQVVSEDSLDPLRGNRLLSVSIFPVTKTESIRLLQALQQLWP